MQDQGKSEREGVREKLLRSDHSLMLLPVLNEGLWRLSWEMELKQGKRECGGRF